jgi:hypothetical protein
MASARDRNALLLAAGELCRMHVGLFGKSHLREQRAAALDRLGPRLLLHEHRALDDIL